MARQKTILQSGVPKARQLAGDVTPSPSPDPDRDPDPETDRETETDPDRDPDREPETDGISSEAPKALGVWA
ncbi:MAG TPA: hypothetical protein PKK44_07425 [Candidatus Hydrogenedentes bacterium]|nr:hypothetical protein [Candidatus Hydrogenedentota bacterium]